MRLIDADALPVKFDGHTVSVWQNDLDAAPTVNPYEWISVEDRLPKLYQGVLVYTWNGLNNVCWYGDDNSWHSESYVYDPEDVTHWMPLPAPPIEKEN